MTASVERRFAFRAAVATAVTTTLAFAMAIATPPISGSWCTAGCIEYPYRDIAGRFPRDYLWMAPAMLAALAMVAFVSALRRRGEARGVRHPLLPLAVLLAATSALTIVVDYAIQLEVIQPSVAAGEHEGIALWTQYNPHGLFIALEEIGYLAWCGAFACVAPALGDGRAERVVRRIMQGGAAASVLALVAIAAGYGNERGYRFEIAVISIAWLVAIASSATMAVVLGRELRADG